MSEKLPQLSPEESFQGISFSNLGCRVRGCGFAVWGPGLRVEGSTRNCGQTEKEHKTLHCRSSATTEVAKAE